MVERFNGRIEEVLQSHHFRSGEELKTTLNRYMALYNQQLPQSALGSRTPLQAMKDWHKLKAELLRKQPYYLPRCDSYRTSGTKPRQVRYAKGHQGHRAALAGDTDTAESHRRLARTVKKPGK